MEADWKRPVHSGLSRMMKTAVYFETHDLTFDAEPMTEKYGVEPTGVPEWMMKIAITATASSK